GARTLVAQARSSLTERPGVSAAPVGMVLGAVAAVQFGAGLAVTLFAQLGPVGTVLLRVGFAAIVLLIAWRPRVRAHPTPVGARGRLRTLAGAHERALLPRDRPHSPGCRRDVRVHRAARRGAGGVAT